MRYTIKPSFLFILFLFSLLVACGQDTSQQKQESEIEEVTQEDTSEIGQEDTSDVVPEESFAVNKNDPNWKQNLQQPKVMTFEEGKQYFWDMQTNKGSMSFKLFHQRAPMHVTSTIYLTELGFYDSIIFHRVIPGFMAQGGDPTGTGRSGPGYSYEGEFGAAVSHDRPGLLSMANAGPGTDGSQFFITFVPTPFLDGKHTIFGEITGGIETLQALENKGSPSGQTSEQLEIIKATIRVE